MEFLIYIGIALLAVAVIANIVFGRQNKKEAKVYNYAKKKFLLTKAENEFYNALLAAVGHDYHIFTQVHLPSFIDNKITGQNWNGAFRHISQKSVDFLLCNKKYLNPILAIELDDKSHERGDRQERDKEVERILQQADLPLLRLTNQANYNPAELSEQIKNIIPTNS